MSSLRSFCAKVCGELLLNQPLSMNKLGKKLAFVQSTRLIDMTSIGPISRILRHDLSKIERGM